MSKTRTMIFLSVLAVILMSGLIYLSCGVDTDDHEGQTEVMVNLDSYISNLSSQRAGIAQEDGEEEYPARYDVMIRVTADDLDPALEWFFEDYHLGDKIVIWVPSGRDRTFEIWLYETPEGYPASDYFPAILHITVTPSEDRTIDCMGEEVELQLDLRPITTLSTVQTYNGDGYFMVEKDGEATRIPGSESSPCEVEVMVTFVDVDFNNLVLRHAPVTVGPNDGEYYVEGVPVGRRIQITVEHTRAGWIGESDVVLIQQAPNPVNVVCEGWKNITVSPSNEKVADGDTSQNIKFEASGAYGEYNFSHTMSDAYATIDLEEGDYDLTGTVIGADSVDSITVADACAVADPGAATAYWYVAPEIDEIIPSVSMPSGLITATIYGSGFDESSQAYIGTSSAATSFVGAYELEVTVPPNVAGVYDVRVINVRTGTPFEDFGGFEDILDRSFRYLSASTPPGEMDEKEFNDSMPHCNQIGINTTVHGTILDRFDTDFFCFNMDPEVPLAIWLEAETQGSPLDGRLMFFDPSGGEIVLEGALGAPSTPETPSGHIPLKGMMAPWPEPYFDQDDSYYMFDPVILVEEEYLDGEGIYSVMVGSSWRPPYYVGDYIIIESANNGQLIQDTDQAHTPLGNGVMEKDPPYGPQGGEDYSYTLEVKQAVTVQGFVRNEGTPVSDAEIYFFADNVFDYGGYTQLDGSYKINLPPWQGYWEVWAYSYSGGVGRGLLEIGKDTTTANLDIELQWTDADDCDLVKSGRLLFSDGQPAPKALIAYQHVWYSYWYGSLRTGDGDSVGQYVMSQPMATQLKHGYVEMALPDDTSRFLSITDCTSAFPDMYLKPKAAIQGRLLWSDTVGLPASDCSVVAVDSYGNAAETYVEYGDDGYFFLMGDLEPGIVTVWAGNGSYYGNYQVNLKNKDSHITGLQILVNKPNIYATDFISGEVKYPNSPPAMGFLVSAQNGMNGYVYNETYETSGHPGYNDNGRFYVPYQNSNNQFPFGPYMLMAYDLFSVESFTPDYPNVHPFFYYGGLIEYISTYFWANVEKGWPFINVPLLNTEPRCKDGYDNNGNGMIDYQPEGQTSDDVTMSGMKAGACCFPAHTVIIRPGENGDLETIPRGDDEILLGNIVVGADGQVNTTVVGDPVCTSEDFPFEFENQCNDGLDNDESGYIDYQPPYVDDQQYYYAGYSGLSPDDAIICAGYNEILETQPRGDDQIKLMIPPPLAASRALKATILEADSGMVECIIAGPNGTVNTTVYGDEDCSSLTNPFEIYLGGLD